MIKLNWNQNNPFNYPISNYKLEVSENNSSFTIVPNSGEYFISNIQTSKAAYDLNILIIYLLFKFKFHFIQKISVVFGLFLFHLNLNQIFKRVLILL